MTQMLLFDAPAAVTLPVASPAAPEPTTPAPRPSAALTSRDRSVSLYDSSSGDIQHMGDLAKLVLLRYELLHQRRAARRRRQSSAR